MKNKKIIIKEKRRRQRVRIARRIKEIRVLSNSTNKKDAIYSLKYLASSYPKYRLVKRFKKGL